jgi:hypothetical protein
MSGEQCRESQAALTPCGESREPDVKSLAGAEWRADGSTNQQLAQEKLAPASLRLLTLDRAMKKIFIGDEIILH